MGVLPRYWAQGELTAPAPRASLGGRNAKPPEGAGTASHTITLFAGPVQVAFHVGDLSTRRPPAQPPGRCHLHAHRFVPAAAGVWGWVPAFCSKEKQLPRGQTCPRTLAIWPWSRSLGGAPGDAYLDASPRRDHLPLLPPPGSACPLPIDLRKASFYKTPAQPQELRSLGQHPEASRWPRTRWPSWAGELKREEPSSLKGGAAWLVLSPVLMVQGTPGWWPKGMSSTQKQVTGPWEWGVGPLGGVWALPASHRALPVWGRQSSCPGSCLGTVSASEHRECSVGTLPGLCSALRPPAPSPLPFPGGSLSIPFHSPVPLLQHPVLLQPLLPQARGGFPSCPPPESLRFSNTDEISCFMAICGIGTSKAGRCPSCVHGRHLCPARVTKPLPEDVVQVSHGVKPCSLSLCSWLGACRPRLLVQHSPQPIAQMDI